MSVLLNMDTGLHEQDIVAGNVSNVHKIYALHKLQATLSITVLCQ